MVVVVRSSTESRKAFGTSRAGRRPSVSRDAACTREPRLGRPLPDGPAAAAATTICQRARARTLGGAETHMRARETGHRAAHYAVIRAALRASSTLDSRQRSGPDARTETRPLARWMRQVRCELGAWTLGPGAPGVERCGCRIIFRVVASRQGDPLSAATGRAQGYRVWSSPDGIDPPWLRWRQDGMLGAARSKCFLYWPCRGCESDQSPALESVRRPSSFGRA